ncbi:MAG: folate-binding protein YgfZ [Gammaproteobacteria bacterium]|nr:folate-binding protein YgfZ [Gammaproteobacteria bacterium]
MKISDVDAGEFLQGQLSNDVTALKDGDAQWTSYNTPKGRVIAVGVLARRADDYYWSIPASLIASTIDQLQRFILRADVIFEDQTEAWVRFGMIAPLADQDRPEKDWLPPNLLKAVALDDGWCVQTHFKNDLLFYEVHLPQAAGRDVFASLAAISQNDFRLEANIKADVPWLSPDSSGKYTAHMLNLDKLNAISFDKGCYVGQEVIARTEHLGKVKRRLRHANYDANHETTNSKPILSITQGDKCFAQIVA